MKLTRLLLLVPAAGLLMTGCDKKPSEPTVDSISVSGVYKQAYAVNEKFEKTGLVVTATYSDGSKKDVTSSASFSGFSSKEAGQKTISVSAEGKSASFNVEVKAGVHFDGQDRVFGRLGLGDIIIPSYFGEAVEGEFYGLSYGYVLQGTTAEELEAFAASFAGFGWTAVEDSESADFEFSYGEDVSCFLADGTESYGMVMVGFEYPYTEAEAFPSSDVSALFSYFGIEAAVPAYESADPEIAFEGAHAADDSFQLYVEGNTSGDEHEAYKDALVEAGWVVVDDYYGDYILRFGETAAFAYLENDIDYGEDYNYVEFYVAPFVPQINAINAAFSEALEGEDFISYAKSYGYWTGYVDLTNPDEAASYVDEAPETLLQPALEEVASLMPESLGQGEYKFYASEDHYWGASDPATAAVIAYEGEGYEANLVAYCYNSSLIVSLYFYVL